MFDIDEFVADCTAALGETESRGAVREVLARALADRDAVAEALKPSGGEFTVLHNTPDLTVLHVVWPAGFSIVPHDHRMWAAIGIYGGREDNAFYRRSPDNRAELVESGGRTVVDGEILLLGDDTIHAVTNPLERPTGAIHVYGGDLIHAERSQWGPGPRVERPYDTAATAAAFAAAGRSAAGTTSG
jgi:predicted metal-dependent enzyme (double-stranded beta helix superfamily)